MLDQQTIDPNELRAAFGCFPTGVTVVSMLDEAGAPTGVTIGSFSSLSLSPALCLFSLGKNQASARLFEADVNFVVNVLSKDMEKVAWQFATPSEEKCAGIDLHETGCGVPRLRGATAHFVCRTQAIHDGGDHIIVIGEILDLDHEDGDALIFYRGTMQHVAAS